MLYLYLKIILNIFIILFIRDIKNKIIEKNSSFEYYFCHTLKKFFHSNINYNCSNDRLPNINFYDNIEEYKKNINIFLNIKKTKIENIFLLLAILPILKNNSTIIYRINNKDIFNLFKKIFIYKKIKNKIIKINENDFHYFNENFNHFLGYKWELIPKKNIINNLRYIINNFYNESCLEIFDKSLNLNFKYFIKKKKNKLSSKDINNLFSKFFAYLFIFIVFIENIGIYEKEKCVGKGSTGRVS